MLEYNLNTSHVNVQLITKIVIQVLRTNLNTSHVNVQRRLLNSQGCFGI